MWSLPILPVHPWGFASYSSHKAKTCVLSVNESTNDGRSYLPLYGPVINLQLVRGAHLIFHSACWRGTCSLVKQHRKVDKDERMYGFKNILPWEYMPFVFRNTENLAVSLTTQHCVSHKAVSCIIFITFRWIKVGQVQSCLHLMKWNFFYRFGDVFSEGEKLICETFKYNLSCSFSSTRYVETEPDVNISTWVILLCYKDDLFVCILIKLISQDESLTLMSSILMVITVPTEIDSL